MFAYTEQQVVGFFLGPLTPWLSSSSFDLARWRTLGLGGGLGFVCSSGGSDDSDGLAMLRDCGGSECGRLSKEPEEIGGNREASDGGSSNPTMIGGNMCC